PYHRKRRMPPVATPSPDLRSRAGLTVVDGRSPSLSSHDVPAGLRMVRALDRAVLEAARQSQAKQIALRLCARGLAVRYGAYGRTELTAAGRELADAAASDLEDAVAGRMAAIDPALRVLGTATLADLTLPTSA